jgi:GntR family transcriptional regulator/MocR family aminotransferase
VDLHISLGGRGDRTDRIYRQLRDAILDGRLRHGERVPPSRELARSLSVARNTVAAAYDRLVGDGFLAGRSGAGTFVAYRGEPMLSRRAPAGPLRPSRRFRSLPQDPPPVPAARFDLRIGHPDAALFPLAAWRRLVARSLRASADYRDPAGHPGLREALSRHVGLSRSVRAGAEDVLVTAGAQQAVDLVGRVLIEPGDVVAVEEPGYRPVRRLLQSHGARVAGVPVDADGIVVDAIAQSARLVYVTPSHQHPLGTAMSLARRTALLAWAQEHGAAIVEDDYDSEFRYSDRPLEPLQSIDRAGRVIYVGSFSKTMLPTLRLGFAVLPPSLRDAAHRAKYVTDWHTSGPAQAALASFIDEGGFARHVRKMNATYRARHELLSTILARDFNDQLEVVPSAAGLHVTALARKVSVEQLSEIVQCASAAGVEVQQLSAFAFTSPAQAGLVLGYGAISAANIEQGLRRLRSCFR